MKFTDGYWQNRPGVTSHYPAQIHDVEVDRTSGSLTVYLPTTRINHRGDTVNIPVLAARYSSPMPDVICVQLYHHKGIRLRGPSFPLFETGPAEVRIQEYDQMATLTRGGSRCRCKRPASGERPSRTASGRSQPVGGAELA